MIRKENDIFTENSPVYIVNGTNKITKNRAKKFLPGVRFQFMYKSRSFKRQKMLNTRKIAANHEHQKKMSNESENRSLGISGYRCAELELVLPKFTVLDILEKRLK